MGDINYADELRKFHKLYEDGIISQEDFDKKKQELLGASQTPQATLKLKFQTNTIVSKEQIISYIVTAILSLISAVMFPALKFNGRSPITGKGVLEDLPLITNELIIGLMILLAVVSLILLIKKRELYAILSYGVYFILFLVGRHEQITEYSSYGPTWLIRPATLIIPCLAVLMGFTVCSRRLFEKLENKKYLLMLSIIIIGILLTVYGVTGNNKIIPVI